MNSAQASLKMSRAGTSGWDEGREGVEGRGKGGKVDMILVVYPLNRVGEKEKEREVERVGRVKE